MSFHDLFFGIAALIYDLVLSPIGIMILIGCTAHWLKFILENGLRSNRLLMAIGGIALLVIIIPESNKKQERERAREAAYYKAHPEEEADPRDYME